MIKAHKHSVVHKFELKFTCNELRLPMDAIVLTAQCQGDKVMIWALVDPLKQMVTRTFIVKGTGHSIGLDGDVIYINTCQDSSNLVWHVFELSI